MGCKGMTVETPFRILSHAESHFERQNGTDWSKRKDKYLNMWLMLGYWETVFYGFYISACLARRVIDGFCLGLSFLHYIPLYREQSQRTECLPLKQRAGMLTGHCKSYEFSKVQFLLESNPLFYASITWPSLHSLLGMGAWGTGVRKR